MKMGFTAADTIVSFYSNKYLSKFYVGNVKMPTGLDMRTYAESVGPVRFLGFVLSNSSNVFGNDSDELIVLYTTSTTKDRFEMLKNPELKKILLTKFL